MDGPSGDSAPKGDGKGKAAEKRGGKGERSPCKFFGTDDGCKKGAECTYLHDWTTIDKRGRCWNCSSTKNSKREYTVKAMSTGGGAPDAGGKGKKGGGKGKEVEGTASILGMKKADKPDYTSHHRAEEVGSVVLASHPGGEGDSGRAAPAMVAAHHELLPEATTLLKRLRGPALRAMKINSFEVHGEGKTLLDGGATHALRTAKNLKEWESALEVRVELAQGPATLRQLPWSKHQT